MPDGGARNTAPTIQRGSCSVLSAVCGDHGASAPLGTLDYQAVQISWDKRLSQGVFFQVNYTDREHSAMAPLNQ